MLIAVLALLGSALCLLMGIFMLAVPLLAPLPNPAESPLAPGFFKLMMWLSALFYLGPAVWGTLTGIGLLRLKEWARISTIVFSVLLIAMNGFGLLMFLLIPFPTSPSQAVDPSVITGVRVFAGAFALTLLSVGVWWLVFLNRAKVKQQFATPAAVVAGGMAPESMLPFPVVPVAIVPRRPDRPLSLTIIAWLLLVGCLFIPLNLVWHGPAILFTRIITGWAAALYFLSLAAIHLYIGIGLLRLNPTARTVGIAYFLFVLMNTVVFYFAPDGESRMLDLIQRSQSSFPWMQPPPHLAFSLDMKPFLRMGMVAGLLGVLLPLYFLITRKAAYERAVAAGKVDDNPAPG